MPSHALSKPVSRTYSTGRTFIHTAVRVWNSLLDGEVGEIKDSGAPSTVGCINISCQHIDLLHASPCTLPVPVLMLHPSQPMTLFSTFRASWSVEIVTTTQTTTCASSSQPDSNNSNRVNFCSGHPGNEFYIGQTSVYRPVRHNQTQQQHAPALHNQTPTTARASVSAVGHLGNEFCTFRVSWSVEIISSSSSQPLKQHHAPVLHNQTQTAATASVSAVGTLEMKFISPGRCCPHSLAQSILKATIVYQCDC
ncbi:uncharacterized protein LOC119728393 [Patiria miniata]|uniref:Uncharacterized protein n=1 Tax=Patiria miniata TaxID=46514 RepID=A0A913ZYZ7_PATMI|nr:uncharacterized protein LOC119728393 [Patiria miniata]